MKEKCNTVMHHPTGKEREGRTCEEMYRTFCLVGCEEVRRREEFFGSTEKLQRILYVGVSRALLAAAVSFAGWATCQ